MSSSEDPPPPPPPKATPLPVKRKLMLPPMEPSFSSDNHRFGSPKPKSLGVHEAGAIAVTTPKQLRKSNEANSSVPDSSLPRTPFSNAVRFTGSPSRETVTPAPDFSSLLGVLTAKFIDLIKQADGGLDLSKAAKTLEVTMRRIYDVSSALEGLGLIEKKKPGVVQWKGLDGDINYATLQAEIKTLYTEERRIDDQIKKMKQTLRDLTEDEFNKKLLFFTGDEIKSFFCLKNQTLIAIQGPQDTTMEFPHLDKFVDNPQRRHRIILRSTTGQIDAYLMSPFEKVEDLTHELKTRAQNGSTRRNVPVVDVSYLKKLNYVFYRYLPRYTEKRIRLPCLKHGVILTPYGV